MNGEGLADADAANPFRLPRLHPGITQRGSDQLIAEEHDRGWVIHRHVVREHGAALAGPDPRTLIDPGRC